MEPFGTVGVIGAGTMGHALALVHAIAGCNVRLTDRSPDTLAWAQTRILDLTGELFDLGLINAAEKDEVPIRIQTITDLNGAVADADLVIEAIVESEDAKRELYDLLATCAPDNAVLASNTSFLDIFPLLPDALRARTLIVHWYTPPYLIDLVDIVPAPDAMPGLAQTMVTFLRGIGKRPVLLKKFVPGYIANNVQMAIEAEVFRLLDDGIADIEDIDEAVRFGLGQRLSLMGQFKKIDYTGLEVVRDIHAKNLYDPPRQPTGSPKLEKLIETGASGVRAGRGFYDYSLATPSDYLKRRDRALARLKRLMDENPDEI